MKRYIKTVSMICAIAATTTLCAGALAEDGGIPRLADAGWTAAPVVRAMSIDTPDITRLSEADAIVKAASFGEIDKSVELGTDGALTLKNDVERVIVADGAAVEKTLALGDELTKNDVERVIGIDEAAVEKTLALGDELTKNDVERVIAADGAAAEKSLALDDEFTKKDVERAILPDVGISKDAALGTDAAYTARNDAAALTTEDNVLHSVQLGEAEPIARDEADVERAVQFEGGSVEKSAALGDEFTKNDIERVILADDVGAVKSLSLGDEFAKNDIERAILIDDVGAVKSLSLGEEFAKKDDADVERAITPEDIGAEKSEALEVTEPFVKRDAAMVDRAIEDEGATKVLNPYDSEAGGDILRGSSDEMIDKRVIAPGEISEKRTDKIIDIELGRNDIARGITLGEGGEVVRSQNLDGVSGIGKLGEGEVIRP